MEPACEVNEKSTREKNDGNESMSLDDNEKIEVGSDENLLQKRTRMNQNRTRCQKGQNQIRS